MSSDIYIPLSIVLSHQGQFELMTDFNVGVEDAKKELSLHHPDYHWVNQCIEPVLMCRFGRRAAWRHVSVVHSNHIVSPICTERGKYRGLRSELLVTCGDEFCKWLIQWLDDLGYEYTVL